MSSDDSSISINPNEQAKTGSSSIPGKTVLENNLENAKQDKYKQDQLRMEKFREEMSRQEKLRQELEDQELKRQQGLQQEQTYQQALQKPEKLKKQQKLEELKRKLAEQKRVEDENKLLAQLKAESESVAIEKISEERVRQEKLMTTRLQKKQLEREQQQKAPTTQAFEQQPIIIDDTPDPEVPVKSAILGIADKLRSSLKSTDENTGVVTKTETEITSESDLDVFGTDLEMNEETPEVIRKDPVSNSRSLQLCGNIEDQVYSESLDSVRYDPEAYVLSSILYYLDQTKRSSTVIRLNFKDIVLVIDYALNTIYCSVPMTNPKFDEFCSRPFMPSVDVCQLEYDEIRLERRNTKNAGNSIEAFIWTSSLLTAKGRLPSYMDLSRTVGIKQDADFSRLESIPYQDEIVAELKQNPSQLTGLSTRLNIPQKYVISFYTAAANINYLEFNQKTKKPSKTAKPAKSKKGFFSFIK